MKPESTLSRTLFLGFAMVAAATTVFAKPADEAQLRLKTGTGEVLKLIYDTPRNGQPLSAGARPTLENYFDLEAITRRAIGPGWKKFSTDQQTKAIKLFSEVVIRTYADRFDPVERPAISYQNPTALAADKVELPTTIGYLGKKYAVVYRMEKAAGADWRVTDVIVEGVSMIGNYRAQFDAVFQKGGSDAVLRSLDDALAKLGPPK